MVALRKVTLLAVDVACTILTLMTGLQENPILVSLSARYDLIRARFDQGNINYNIVREDVVNIAALPTLVDVSSTYRFITAPTRSPHNLGEDRSTCMRVNSMSTSVLAIQFDDLFGKGARREQIFLYSISASHCQVINFESEWLETTCIETMFSGDATACYQYVFDNFDALSANRQLQVGVEQDFGAPGRPLLKCLGRSQKSFEYMTDLLVLQSYWAGGSYHIEIQSSTCRATPVVRDSEWQYGLFLVEAANQSAAVVCAMRETSWVATAVSSLFGLVSLVLISHGIFVALALDNVVKYVPRHARHKHISMPIMAISSRILPLVRKTDVVFSRGERFFASDIWMNHWLYIALSIADAVLRVRTTYVVLEMGAWMLKKQRNFDNFLFVCTALTRLTWLTCFAHTLVRYALKLLLRLLQRLRRLTKLPLDALDWYIDGVALFVGYKVYAVLISGFLYLLLQTRGTTSFMTRQSPSTSAVAGGFADIASFWRSEVVCDLGVTCAIALVAGSALATALLCTRYRALASNRLLRLLQNRYIFVGWDLLVAIEALGVDTSHGALLGNGVAVTNCSFASLLQQLYASGPSGLVEFAGDAVFLSSPPGDQDKREAAASSSTLRYSPFDAQRIGLCAFDADGQALIAPNDNSFCHSLEPSNHRSDHSKRHASVFSSSVAWQTLTRWRRSVSSVDGAAGATAGRSDLALPPASLEGFCDRTLGIFSDSRYGRVVLVDAEHAPGRLERSPDGATLEFVVQDALSLLRPHELSAFLSRRRLLLRIS